MVSMVASASARYPGTEWHGQSNIHVSFCRGVVLDHPAGARGKILHLLNKAEVGKAFYNYVTRNVPGMEFLLESEVFHKLMLVDVNLVLQGQNTSYSPDRITNPVTGNIFHRIALDDPFIGSVRFWAEALSISQTVVAFRFRIVRMESKEDDPNVREEARIRETQVLAEMDSVYAAIMDIPEPTIAEYATVKHSLLELEH